MIVFFCFRGYLLGPTFPKSTVTSWFAPSMTWSSSEEAPSQNLHILTLEEKFRHKLRF